MPVVKEHVVSEFKGFQIKFTDCLRIRIIRERKLLQIFGI